MSYYTKSDREDTPKYFDPDEYVIKAGKKVIWREFTQENNKDLNIYEVLEKYNGEYRRRLQFDPEVAYSEIDEALTLDKAFERNQAAQQAWLNLPMDIRAEFDNNVHEFIDRGKDWLKNKIDTAKAEEAKKEAELKKIQAEEKAKQKILEEQYYKDLKIKLDTVGGL